MPEPGYRGLKYGERTEVEEATAIADAAAPEEVEVEAEVADEELADEVDEEDLDDEDDDEDDDLDEDFGDPEGRPLTDIEQIIAQPSRRPDEPVTAGIPYGPGADDLPIPGESPRQFMLRVADRLSSVPGASQAVKSWADRVRAGA